MGQQVFVGRLGRLLLLFDLYRAGSDIGVVTLGHVKSTVWLRMVFCFV